MADEKEKTGVSIYMDVSTKEEIENFFLDNRIKNYQEGYREILREGFKVFKKQKEKR